MWCLQAFQKDELKDGQIRSMETGDDFILLPVGLLQKVVRSKQAP